MVLATGPTRLKSDPSSRNECPDDKLADLFDESLGYEDEVGIQLPPELTLEEKQQASRLYRIFNGLWGLAVVKGLPGTGKDLFSNYFTYKIKRCFPWKRILRDEKPRALFGPYAGVFNETALVNDLARMQKIATGVSAVKVDEVLDKAADDWAKGAGSVLLKNSVLYLTEFWRYCNLREPHNPMNRTMGAVHRVYRHLDCLVLGTIQLVGDLDKRTAKPFINWEVTCTRSSSNKTGFVYYVSKVAYDRRKDVLVSIGRPEVIAFDAGKPRSYLGNGKIVLKKPEYRPVNEEERVVLEALKAGVERYEELVEVLETDGDMCENEVLETLKNLKFVRTKRIVDYPCYFGLYNSKSAPQIRTTLKGTKME